MTEIVLRVRLRNDTANAWTNADPVLSVGEFGIESDTDKLKLGDGSTAWTSLAYFGNANFDTNSVTELTDFATATTSELEDIADAINTDAAKVLGRAVYNVTTGVTVFASGNTDGAVWHYYDSTTAHTPVV